MSFWCFAKAKGFRKFCHCERGKIKSRNDNITRHCEQSEVIHNIQSIICHSEGVQSTTEESIHKTIKKRNTIDSMDCHARINLARNDDSLFGFFA